MQVEAEVIENKAKARMNALRLEALINALSKEGIITKEEVESELKNLANKEDE